MLSTWYCRYNEETKKTIYLKPINCYCYLLLIQFDCTNTLNDQLLENVSVAVEAPEGFDVIVTIPCPKLEYSILGTCYVALSLPDSMLNSTGMCFGFLTY